MAKQYSPPHSLPYDWDLDIPPIELQNLVPLTLRQAGLVTPLMIQDNGSDTYFQDWIINGDAASTLSPDHLHLKP